MSSSSSDFLFVTLWLLLCFSDVVVVVVCAFFSLLLTRRVSCALLCFTSCARARSRPASLRWLFLENDYFVVRMDIDILVADHLETTYIVWSMSYTTRSRFFFFQSNCKGALLFLSTCTSTHTHTHARLFCLWPICWKLHSQLHKHKQRDSCAVLHTPQIHAFGVVISLTIRSCVLCVQFDYSVFSIYIYFASSSSSFSIYFRFFFYELRKIDRNARIYGDGAYIPFIHTHATHSLCRRQIGKQTHLPRLTAAEVCNAVCTYNFLFCIWSYLSIYFMLCVLFFRHSVPCRRRCMLACIVPTSSRGLARWLLSNDVHTRMLLLSLVFIIIIKRTFFSFAAFTLFFFFFKLIFVFCVSLLHGTGQ